MERILSYYLLTYLHSEFYQLSGLKRHYIFTFRGVFQCAAI